MGGPGSGRRKSYRKPIRKKAQRQQQLVKEKIARGTKFKDLIVEGTINGLYQCRCVCGHTQCMGTLAVKGQDLLDGLITSCGGSDVVDGASANESTRLIISKRGARKRGIMWELTDVQALELMRGTCYYKDCDNSPCSNKKLSKYGINGIDRVDNSKGYTVENTVPCCMIHNHHKLACSIGQAARMVEHESERRYQEERKRNGWE